MKATPFITGSDFFSGRIGLLKLLIVTITAVFLCSVSNAAEIKGMSYIAWDPNGLLTQNSDTSLANIKKTGCNWVGLCVVWFQDDINSTLIEPDYSRYSSTPEAVIHAIDKCHELHMKVMLKPHVECRDGTWQGRVNPSPAWFSTYQNFINFWADIAKNHNVELFCVGAELANTTGGSWSDSWRNVIHNVRNHYTGPLTYGANPGEEENISWWNEVNYIGIDAYYPLTDENDPTPAQLKSAWGSRADVIESWRNSTWPNMQIIFTEIGYRSIDGTNKAPWYRPPPPYHIDLQEQADCYDALLSQCKSRPWWSGVFWWNWEVDPNLGGPNDPRYTPHNKPAEAVLAHYYVCLKGDLTRDSKIDFKDLSTLDTNWLSRNPLVDIYPAPCGDGVIDLQDFADLAKNWMADFCLDCDVSGNCKVDSEDLHTLASKWLYTCEPNSIVFEDINRDGHVDLVDYALLARSWMESSFL